MKVYHGSYVAIEVPDLLHSRANVDFGKGFYVTPIYEQACRWCTRFKQRGEQGVVSHFDFDEDAYDMPRVLTFDAYSQEWLDFIVKCRSGQDDTDYDIVVGGVANDRVFNTLELFFDGLIDKEEAIKRLRYEEPNLQIALRTVRALSYLRYEGSEIL